MKKTCLALAVVSLVLGMTLTGCAGKKAGTSSGPVSITINSYDVGMADFESKAWYKKLVKDLNVRLEERKLDVEQLNLALASGDLPDITILPANSSSLVASIIQADIAVDLSPYLQNKLSNLSLPAYAPVNDLMKEFMGGPDRKLYFTTIYLQTEEPEGGIMAKRGYITRWDYYKEIGAPVVNNDDDYLAVLKAMQAKHPTTRTGKKTYAIGVEKNFGDMAGYRAATTRSDIALNVWAFAGTRYATDMFTGQLVNGYTDMKRSMYWTDMRFYNKLDRAGLFDPDSFSMSFDEYKAKIVDGAYMSLYYRDDFLYPSEAALDPETRAVYVPIPSTGAFAFANQAVVFGKFPQHAHMIPKTTKNLDKALEVLNWLYAPDNSRELNTGEKGVYWDYDANGKPYLTEKALEDRRAGIKPTLGSGQLFPWGIAAIHPDGYYYDLMLEKEYRSAGLSPALQDFCDYYGVNFPAEVQYNLFLEGKVKDLSNDYGQSVSAFIVMPTDIKRISDATVQIFERAMPRLIQAKTDAEFLQIQNQVLSDAKAAGEDTVWQWVSAEYSRLEKVIHPLFQKAREFYVHK
jgi:hypothetical protein